MTAPTRLGPAQDGAASGKVRVGRKWYRIVSTVIVEGRGGHRLEVKITYTVVRMSEAGFDFQREREFGPHRNHS